MMDRIEKRKQMPFGVWEKDALLLPLFTHYDDKLLPFYCDSFWSQPGFGFNARMTRHDTSSSKVP